MILIAHKTAYSDEATPRFWIDAEEEAALTVALYERHDNSLLDSSRVRRGDAAPELVDCYDVRHEQR